MADEGKFAIGMKRTAGLAPAGIYRMVIRKVDVNDGPSGYPYLNLELAIAEKKGEKAIYNDRTVFQNVSASPAARWKMEEFLDAVGAPEEGNLTPDWFQGKVMYCRLIQDEFEGKKRLRVENMIARGEVAQALAEEAAAKAKEPAEATPAPTPTPTEEPKAKGKGKAAAPAKVTKAAADTPPLDLEDEAVDADEDDDVATGPGVDDEDLWGEEAG